MRLRSTMASLAITVLGAACAVDTAGEAELLLATDRAWADAASAGDVDSMLTFWTDDARVVSADQPTYHGKPAIRAMVTASLAVPGFQVTWTPDSAVVSRGGDLGYTYGTNAFTFPDSAGTPTTQRGRYLAVWRKEADGRWRCVMDFGTPGT